MARPVQWTDFISHVQVYLLALWNAKEDTNNKYSICVHHIVHAINPSIVYALYEGTRVVVRVCKRSNGDSLRCRHRSCEHSVNRL